MKALIAVVLLVGLLVGCNGDDKDSMLEPKEERAVRAHFASYGAGERETSCVIDELLERVGADRVALVPRLSEEPELLEREEREEMGTEFGEAMLACKSNPVRTDCFSIWKTKADARSAARRASAQGFDRAWVGRGSNRRGPVPAVTFSTGKTGAAAKAVRAGFERFVRQAGGQVGHGGDGCLEKPFFD